MSLRAATAAVLALALIGAAWAAADSARAVTGPADVLAAGRVNGTGTVNDGGQPGTWHFEYVYTDGGRDYSFTTAPQQAEASADDQAVSQPLDYIVSGTTYRYRLVLQTPDAEFDGDWAEFTTPSIPPIKSAPPTPRVYPVSSRLHIARDHTIPVRIGCAPGRAPCHGRVVLTLSPDPSVQTKNLTLTAHFVAPAGARTRVRLRLAPAGRRLLGRNELQVYIVVQGFDSNGPGSNLSALRSLSLK